MNKILLIVIMVLLMNVAAYATPCSNFSPPDSNGVSDACNTYWNAKQEALTAGVDYIAPGGETDPCFAAEKSGKMEVNDFEANSIYGPVLPEVTVAANDTPLIIKNKAWYKCSGTNDQNTIQLAIDYAESYGMSSVYLLGGNYYVSAVDSNLVGIYLKDGVSIRGDSTKLLYTEACPDLKFFASGGTVLHGTTGNEIILAGNIDADPVVDSVLTCNIENIAFKYCATAIKIGAKNHNGLAFSRIANIIVDKTDESNNGTLEDSNAIQLINPQHIKVSNISIYRARRGFYCVGWHTGCAGGCSSFDQIQVTLETNPSYGIYFGTLGGSGYQTFDAIIARYLQVNHVNGGALPAHIALKGSASNCTLNKSRIGPIFCDGNVETAANIDMNYCSSVDVDFAQGYATAGLKVWNSSYCSFYSSSFDNVLTYDQNNTNVGCTISGRWKKPVPYGYGYCPRGSFVWRDGSEITYQENLYSSGAFYTSISSNTPGARNFSGIRFVPSYRDAADKGSDYTLDFGMDEGIALSFTIADANCTLATVGSGTTNRGRKFTISNGGANAYVVKPALNEYIDGVQNNETITLNQYESKTFECIGYYRWKSY